MSKGANKYVYIYMSSSKSFSNRLPEHRVVTLFIVAFFAFLVSHRGVEGYCPSNGNNRVLYVTTNSGDNILSFDSSGKYLGRVVNPDSLPSDVEVHKLRSMRFGPGGYLYIASAKGEFSRIFAVTGNGVVNHTMRENCTRDYQFSVTQQSPENRFLDHPYDFEFHPETGDLYVANQNSVTITTYTMVYSSTDKGNSSNAASQTTGKKRSYPRWELGLNNHHALGNTVDEFGSKLDIPNKSGLFASSWSSSYRLRSVRGIAFSPFLPRALVNGTAGPGLYTRDSLTMGYYLLVCDVAGNMVHVFDADTGARLYSIDIPSPIQVRFPESAFSNENSVFDGAGNQIMKVETPYVYVTSKEDGMAYFVPLSPRISSLNNRDPFLLPYSNSLNKRKVEHVYTITKPLQEHSLSGIAEHPTRSVVLIADRSGRRITSYASPLTTDYKKSKGPSPIDEVVVPKLPDQPEFMIFALLENQVNIPFCYELGPRGELEYTALCAAARLWHYAFVIMGLVLTLSALNNIIHRFSPSFSLPKRFPEMSFNFEAIPLMPKRGKKYGTSRRANNV